MIISPSYVFCLYGLPRGSVLVLLFVILYTTPLSTLVSSLSLNLRLYAEITHMILTLTWHNYTMLSSISSPG